MLHFVVTDNNGKDIATTREHLRSPSNPDIGWIPSSVPEYGSASRCLTDKEVKTLCSPLHLSPLQQEFLSLHNKLSHLPFTTMLRLCKLGVLPKRFLKLRNNLPPCASCMFGQAHRRPWRHKTSASNVGGTIRNPKSLVPGEKVCTDQLVSAQPGLVPQEKGSLTRARIWGATIFVDAATDWIKVCLMRDATYWRINA